MGHTARRQMVFKGDRSECTTTLRHNSSDPCHIHPVWKVYTIELVMENMDDLGFFCGLVDEKILEEEDWSEDQLRDSKHFHGMHGDGRLFLASKEKDFGLMRLDTGRVVTLTVDCDKLQLGFVLRGGKSSADCPKIPNKCALAVCFGNTCYRSEPCLSCYRDHDVCNS